MIASHIFFSVQMLLAHLTSRGHAVIAMAVRAMKAGAHGFSCQAIQRTSLSRTLLKAHHGQKT